MILFIPFCPLQFCPRTGIESLLQELSMGLISNAPCDFYLDCCSISLCSYTICFTESEVWAGLAHSHWDNASAWAEGPCAGHWNRVWTAIDDGCTIRSWCHHCLRGSSSCLHFWPALSYVLSHSNDSLVKQHSLYLLCWPFNDEHVLKCRNPYSLKG